jgi:DivIVA domain-containing protein
VALIVLVLVGVLVLAGVALTLTYSDRGLSAEPVDHVDLGLPDRVLTADDIAGLRFRTGARGYRMQDVDAALVQITAALRAAEPSAAPEPPAPAVPPAPPAPAAPAEQ